MIDQSRIVRIASFIGLLLIFAAPGAVAQSTRPNQGTQIVIQPDNSAPGSPPPLVTSPNPSDPNQAHMMREMAKERSVLRQKEIMDETNQLLDLAKELKDAVDKSSKDQLSLNVVNTASEIEKLAKSVKQKMRDGD